MADSSVVNHLLLALDGCAYGRATVVRWMLTMLVACAAPDELCEPYIEYDRGYQAPGVGCHNLEFYEIEVPDLWFPVDTRARVNECKPGGVGERLFECEPDGHWRELFLYDPPP